MRHFCAFSSLLVLLLVLILRGLLLLLGVGGGRQQLLDLLVLDLDGRGDLRLGRRQARDLLRAAREQQHRELELGHDLALLLPEHRVLLEELVALGLGDADAGDLLVLDGAEGEGQRREALVDLRDELPGLLRLEVVGGVHGALVDGVTELRLLALALPRGHHDVDAVDLVALELELVHLLVGRLRGDDDAIPVDDKLLQLVREDALHRLAAVLVRDLGECLGDLRVGVANLDQAQRRLGGVPRALDDVGPLVVDLLLADHDGVGGAGDETVKVARHVDLGHIPILELPRLALQGGEVAHDLVHGDARRERDALLDLAPLAVLLVVELSGLLLDELVAHLAEGGDVGAVLALLDDLLEGLVDDVARGAVLGGDVGAAQVRDLLLGLVVGHGGEESRSKAGV
mmetsp:Transcript_1518/g.4477  ORF Transcript_1518/g.4477 Transcript_1518/m.4477 type:complete len:401 (+) Transcript_1518:242-1444(+)